MMEFFGHNKEQKNDTTLSGYWRGYYTGALHGEVSLLLKKHSNGFSGWAVFCDDLFGTGMCEIKGVYKDNRFQLSCRHFSFAGKHRYRDQFLTKHMYLSLLLQEEELVGGWVSDLWAQGSLHLFKGSVTHAPQLIIPAILWRTWLFLISHFESLFKLGYVVGLFLLIFGPMMEVFPRNFTAYELGIFIFVGLYLFRWELKEAILVTGVSELGPVKLRDQRPISEEQLNNTIQILTNQVQGLNQLRQQEQQTVAFFILDRFFIPRTQVLLWLLGQQSSPLSLHVIKATAEKLGIPENNIAATLEALQNHRCISIDQEIVMITQFGRDFLNFQQLLTNAGLK